MATKNTNAPIVNDTLIDWVIKEEGFLDKPTNIGDGKITLGSGLTAQKWRDKYRKNGNKWTKQDNRAAVREELESRKRWAEDTIPNWENLPDDTKRAMLSYKYNYDFDAKNSPKLFSAMKSGDYIEAVRQMDATSKDPKFKKGLQERRNREQAWGLGALIGSNAPIYQEALPIVEYPDNTRVFNPYTPLFEEVVARPALVPANPTTNYVEVRQAEPEEWRQDDALAAFRMLERAKNYRDSMLWENQPELPQREYNPTEAPYLVTRYDKGGKVDVNTGPYIVSPVTTSYTPLNTIRKRLYENITPFGYENPISRVFNALVKNEQDNSRQGENVLIGSRDPQASTLDAIWATYLNIPEEDRRKIDSNYGITKTPGGYYKLNNPDMAFDFDYNLSDKGPYHNPSRVIRMNGILGNYTIGRDRDGRGDYIYYSDSSLNNNNTPDIKTGWDINPYSNTADDVTDETTEEHGIYGQDRKGLTYNIGKTLLGNIEDISMGIGAPVPIYDKIYLDDYYDTPKEGRGAHYLPEITIRANKKAGGGDLDEENTDKKRQRYPVVPAGIYGVEFVKWLKENPKITGMAIGAGQNGIDGPRRIVHNPYSSIITDPNDPRWKGLDEIESIRHFMDEINYNPTFDFSKEQDEFRKNECKGYPYETNDKAWRQSIISRIAVGDTLNLGITPEQMQEYDSFMKKYNKFDEGGNIENKKTWDELSVKEKADMMRVAVENGITSLSEIKDKYNEFAENADIEETVENVNKSKADFVNRLKDVDRQYIKDWEHPGYIATHKLSVGTDSKGNNYIYPEVQNIDGELVDFTRPPYLPYAGIISAEERGDTVRVPSIEQSVRFTENYKKYYPKGKTFAEGGHIYDGTTEESQQMETPTLSLRG